MIDTGDPGNAKFILVLKEFLMKEEVEIEVSLEAWSDRGLWLHIPMLIILEELVM